MTHQACTVSNEKIKRKQKKLKKLLKKKKKFYQYL